jgi:hypothetical protein
MLMQSWDPQWTDAQYLPGGARDDLGVETLSESILADLLPGINNQTRRARYYSFWAWALHGLILDRDAVHTQAGFYNWLRRREDTLILAYLSHGCEGGIAGTEQASPIWASGERSTYPVDWKSLLSVDGGSYQLYYRGALFEMHITREGSLHDDLTDSIGVGLAEAYAQAVAGTRYAQEYLDATRVRKADIEEFAGAGCLCRVGASEVERRRLMDAFFRFDVPDREALKRLASLCLFLDVIEQSEGQPLGESDLRAVLYFWSYGAHHSFVPTGNLLSPAQRWRVFQLRQYFVFAVESFWSLFLNRIATEALSGEEYLAWLLGELNLAELAAEFGLSLSTADARSLSLREFYGSVQATLPVGALEPGPVAQSTPLNERAVIGPIWRNATAHDVQVRAGRALVVLALMYWRSQSWRAERAWTYVSDRYAAGRLPAESYVRHVDRAFVENWSLARWLGWFHHHYLWLQHRRVTIEKLVARGQETAKFELIGDAPPEAGGENGGLAVPRYQGIGIDSPKMNAPRFPSALNILSDLRLITTLTDGGYRLLPDGQAVLERFRNFTIPEWTDPTDEASELVAGAAN